MKKTLIVLFIFLTSWAYSQENEKLIDLGKAYKNFMFRSEPPKETIKRLKENTSSDLLTTSDFILETLTTKNNLLKTDFLKLPDSKTLKNIYIVRAINYNIRKEDQIDNNKLIDSLKSKEIPRNELIDAYYDILFAGVGNKNQPFNLKKVNFELDDYNLENETEKGIFFLECMNLCGTSIWGYINVPKPPNYKEAYSYIEKYPHFNGLNYFEYTDLNFPDFEMIIDSEKGTESYKGYYINKFYETLLYNMICLKKGFGSEKEVEQLLIASILKNQNLYKYSKNSDILESLFKTIKRD
ncbi:hypothetical protein [Flavobacterium urumqiense]|uniref:Uncharacterized protein n=1 Tax=Flavobacterium urumqiense TaxID=935224 RepID=A0A1H5X1T3_9FLAO|nr:hypothetical protein [Flavobacterium urumqiense]SEG05335.1 hypothetical protein SAMN04488130_105138 [Flavobacterium urumqiense]